MNLNEIDTWTSNMYYDYYQKLMPFYETWYNAGDGYRPVAIGRNLTWWLERKETTRKCFIKKCKNKTNDCYMELNQFGTDKISCWECSESSGKKLSGKNKKALISPFERYYNVFEKILWDIESVKISKILKTCRTLYWHNTIRDNELKHITTDKSWNESIGSNFTLDIDIKNKHTNDMYKLWNELYSMVKDVATKLENDEIEYKIMSSGNGIYFITKRILYNIDKEENESKEVFWNKISNGWRNYIKDELVPLFDKHPSFNIDGEEPYTMKFYKSPFSLHQRLDLSAIPLSLDTINNMNNEDFIEISNPSYVIDNWENLLKVWK